MYVPMWLGKYFHSESGVFNSTVMSLPSTVTDLTFSNSADSLEATAGSLCWSIENLTSSGVTGLPSENLRSSRSV